MDGAGQDRGHYLQGGEALLQGLAGQQHVGRLGHIRGVQVVVVGNVLQRVLNTEVCFIVSPNCNCN